MNMYHEVDDKNSELLGDNKLMIIVSPDGGVLIIEDLGPEETAVAMCIILSRHLHITGVDLPDALEKYMPKTTSDKRKP